MNKQLVQEEIKKICEANYKNIRRQYPIGAGQTKELKALGIYELLPRTAGHTDAKMIIEAAQLPKPQGGFNAYGEGEDWTSKPSKLYQAMNETTNNGIADWLIKVRKFYGIS